ncbi:hypothetical protein ABFX02_02G114800 [Erythranthe guttata]
METKGVHGETETPLLMIFHGKRLARHSIYNPSEKIEKRLCMLNTPALRHKKVVGSIYGWLILVEFVDPGDDNSDDYGADCCLFDPISTKTIELPKLKDDPDFYSQCILTKPPTEPDCYILFNGVAQSFCRIGDKEYVTLEDGYESENLLAIASFQGKTYGFVNPDKFVTIHFMGKNIEFREILMEVPWVIPRSSRSYDIWLIEPSQSCGDELLMVQKIYTSIDCKGGVDFIVFRIDTNHQMNCIEVDNIGNQTIFLSESGAGFCCPSVRVKPNSIYYTNDNDRSLYIFDLKERSTSSMLLSSTVSAKTSSASWVPQQSFHSP